MFGKLIRGTMLALGLAACVALTSGDAKAQFGISFGNYSNYGGYGPGLGGGFGAPGLGGYGLGGSSLYSPFGGGYGRGLGYGSYGSSLNINFGSSSFYRRPSYGAGFPGYGYSGYGRPGCYGRPW